MLGNTLVTIQTGFLRYYAAMLVVGMVGLTSYFLLQS